jgi:copper/silver efflux system protein
LLLCLRQGPTERRPIPKPIATPVLGGMVSSLIHVLIVTPVIWTMLKEWELRRGRLEVGKASGILKT